MQINHVHCPGVSKQLLGWRQNRIRLICLSEHVSTGHVFFCLMLPKNTCIKIAESASLIGIEGNLPLPILKGGKKTTTWGDVEHAEYWDFFKIKYVDFKPRVKNNIAVDFCDCYCRYGHLWWNRNCTCRKLDVLFIVCQGRVFRW